MRGKVEPYYITFSKKLWFYFFPGCYMLGQWLRFIWVGFLGCRTGGFSTSEGGNPNLDGFPETWKTQPVILETLPFSNISKQLFCLLFLLLTSANILPVSGSQIVHLPYFWWLDQAHQGCLNPDMLQIYVYTSIYPSLPTPRSHELGAWSDHICRASAQATSGFHPAGFTFEMSKSQRGPPLIIVKSHRKDDVNLIHWEYQQKQFQKLALPPR